LHSFQARLRDWANGGDRTSFGPPIGVAHPLLGAPQVANTFDTKVLQNFEIGIRCVF
jgi:hypothetical protein